ncbi:hypothetical protein [Geoglobus sp.]
MDHLLYSFACDSVGYMRTRSTRIPATKILIPILFIALSSFLRAAET